ncbi:acyltransferase family protein [Burkholderia vietnamiensis]|uniref:acyltransferase family protein n=1 Tax=Burkholderia vietnamiensis TaxID=60552 RepID=UPI001592F66C|nr:acyltransferase [Burkholderia vietnamiensis]
MADQHGKNLEIEALRGIAVVLAIVSHLGNLLYWTDGIEQSQVAFWGGVDIFFAISGFVIAKAFAGRVRSARAQGKFFRGVVAFWVRRIFRIWPTAWLWIILALVMSVAFNRTAVFGTPDANMSDLIAIVANVSNVHFARCLDQTALLCGNNGQYWSLAVEEQFYLLFPLLVLLPRKWFGCLAALVVVGWQSALMAMHWQSPYLYLMRVDSIFLGVSVAYFAGMASYQKWRPTWAANRFAAPLILLALLMAPVHTSEYRPYTMMVSIAGAILVWLASYNRGYILADGTLRRVLTWIGTRSFALYLAHNPVFLFTRELWSRIEPGTAFDHAYAVPFLATAIPLMLVLADLNYRLIESPLRRLGARLADHVELRGLRPGPRNVSLTHGRK